MMAQMDHFDLNREKIADLFTYTLYAGQDMNGCDSDTSAGAAMRLTLDAVSKYITDNLDGNATAQEVLFLIGELMEDIIDY